MRYLLLMLIVLISTPVWAAGTGQVIVGADEVLRGRFVEERHLKGFNGPMSSEGRFIVAPKYGLIWEMEKPFPTTTVITHAGLMQLINGLSIMHLSTQKMPFMLHLYDALSGALAGNWAAIEADFNVTRSGDAQNWEVMLIPHHPDNPAMPFSSINVKGHRFVDSVSMLKPDGDFDTLTFSEESISSSPPTVAERHTFDSVPP